MAPTHPPPYDLAAARAHLARADRRLARWIERIGPCRLEMTGRSPYEALAQAIVYQQLHGRAAAAIHGRLCAAFGRDGAPSARRLVAASFAELRAVGLSRGKAMALQDLARHAVERRIPGRVRAARLSDEELVERLTAVRGVGRWTVEMLLLFTLGRPDVLPASDFGVRQGFARAFGRRELPKPAEIAARGERWRPYRSVASWYLWRVAGGAAA